MLLVHLFEDRELEDVHQLVMEHVPELGEGARVREHHAPLRELGEPLHALGQEIGADVGLLEVLMRGIDDEGNRVRDLVLELHLEVLIALLGQLDRGAREGLFLGVIEDLDVLTAERQPLKRVVVDLVLPERKGLRVTRGRGEQKERRDCEQGDEELHLLHSARPRDETRSARRHKEGNIK